MLHIPPRDQIVAALADILGVDNRVSKAQVRSCRAKNYTANTGKSQILAQETDRTE